MFVKKSGEVILNKVLSEICAELEAAPIGGDIKNIDQFNDSAEIIFWSGHRFELSIKQMKSFAMATDPVSGNKISRQEWLDKYGDE